MNATHIIPPPKLSQRIAIIQKRTAGIMNDHYDLWRRYILIPHEIRGYIEAVAKPRIMTARKDSRFAKVGYRGASP